ncbi:MAG: hypothetical protein J6C00_10130 [Eubacterium sp.]|nr:hypothetical protein [Eubacterium sp.]
MADFSSKNSFGGSELRNTKVVVKAVEEEKVASDIASAEAVGAKTVKVVFNGDLTTTSGVAISVKKGNTALVVNSTTFTDSKTASVALNQSLTAGTYTAVATGVVSGASLTKDFTVDSEEYVASIEITTEKAPMISTAATSTAGVAGKNDNQLATVTYVMKNQYKEVVANATTPTFTISTGAGPYDVSYKNGSGSFKIGTNGTAFIPGDTVYINGVLTTGTHVATVTDTVEIALPANLDQATVFGVYNKTLKKMDTVSSAKLDDGTYSYTLLFTAKDQYGNDLDSETIASNATSTATRQFTILSTNPIFITIGNLANTSTVDVDGKTYVSVPLADGTMAEKGGKAEIQIISSSTGTKGTYEIVADAAGAVNSFNLLSPSEYVVSGEKVEIPFEALDQNGNAVTAFSALNGIVTVTAGNNAPVGFVQNSDGSAKLVLNLTSSTYNVSQDTPLYLTSVVTNNGHFSSATVTQKPVAVVTSVIGLKANSGIDTTLIGTATHAQNITYDKLEIADQYGRTVSDAKVKAWLDTTNNVIYAVSDSTNGLFEVTSDTTNSSFTVNGAGSKTTDTDDGYAVIDGSTKKFVVTPGTDTKETEKITFGLGELATANLATVAKSEKAITFTTSVEAEFKSYEVADLGTLYYKTGYTSGGLTSDYKVEPKVYGVKADGTKVLLDQATYYDISSNAKTDVLDISGNVIKQKDTASVLLATDFQVNAPIDTTHKNITVKVTFTIKSATHGTGSVAATIEKDLVLDNSDPKITTTEFATSSDNKYTISGDTMYASASDINTAIATIITGITVADKTKDQYGVKKASSDANAETVSGTITKVTEANAGTRASHLTCDGTDISNAQAGDTFTLVVKYSGGKCTKSINVVVE